MTEFSNLKPHRGHVDKVYSWCKKKYGRSRYNGRYPEILFRKPDYLTGEDYGYFDELEKIIFLNKEKNETILDLVHTIIHEYTHYLQSMHHYKILSLYHDDDHHPLEIEADSVADRDFEECLSYLESLYKKKKSSIYIQDVNRGNAGTVSSEDHSRGDSQTVTCEFEESLGQIRKEDATIGTSETDLREHTIVS
jgi:hypothetical protein